MGSSQILVIQNKIGAEHGNAQCDLKAETLEGDVINKHHRGCDQTVNIDPQPEGKEAKLDEFLVKLEDKGYVVYSGKGKYVEMGMFQVANMGEIYPADCEKFLAVLKETIDEL